MPRTAKRPDALQLRGAPRRVQGLLPSSAWAATHAALPEVELDVPGRESVSVQVATLPGGGGRALRLELAPSTPPGVYEGRVRLADGERPIVLDVIAHQRLVAVGPPIVLSVEPGGEAGFELEVANTGNESCEIRTVYVVGLFDIGGLDRSLAAGFTADVSGVDRFRVIADELAAGRGAARIRVRKGSGTIEPGDSRPLHVTAQLEPEIPTGRTYFGHWQLHEPTCTLSVRVTALAPKEDR
jgi:hypothetical protein